MEWNIGTATLASLENLRYTLSVLFQSLESGKFSSFTVCSIHWNERVISRSRIQIDKTFWDILLDTKSYIKAFYHTFFYDTDKKHLADVSDTFDFRYEVIYVIASKVIQCLILRLNTVRNNGKYTRGDLFSHWYRNGEKKTSGAEYPSKLDVNLSVARVGQSTYVPT